MRIVILSDVHANRIALEAVLAEVDALAPDQVVVAGDVINRGPEPRACLELLLALRDTHHWQFIKGNHEDFVLLEARGGLVRAPWERQLYAHTHWTMNRVRDLLPRIAEWPDHFSLNGPDGSEVRFVHASMRGNRQGIYEDMEEPVLAELTAPPPAVLVAGHTHIPFVRRVNGTMIVNAGAVGMPFDGITQPSFAVLDWAAGWSARIVRVAYDRVAAERVFMASGYLGEAGPMVPLILDELRQARPRLGLWHRRYEAEVAAGRITLEESVEQLLGEVGAACA